jgi:hypothetical protein
MKTDSSVAATGFRTIEIPSTKTYFPSCTKRNSPLTRSGTTTISCRSENGDVLRSEKRGVCALPQR